MVKKVLNAIVVTAAFFLLCSDGFSQPEIRPIGGWRFDFAGGINQSKITGSGVDYLQEAVTSHNQGKIKSTPRKGLEFEASAVYILDQFAHFKTGLLFVQRGESFDNTDYTELPKAKSSYVGIPLLFGLTTTSYKSNFITGLYANAGFAYLINVNDQSTYWMESHYNVFDFVGEAGVEIRISQAIYAGIKYKVMKDLGRAYSFKSNGGGDKDYYNFTSAGLVNVRLNLSGQ